METLGGGVRQLAARLREAHLDERIAALLEVAVNDALGVASLQGTDPAAHAEWVALLHTHAQHAGTTAVNKLAFDILSALDTEPGLREKLATLEPRSGHP